MSARGAPPPAEQSLHTIGVDMNERQKTGAFKCLKSTNVDSVV